MSTQTHELSKTTMRSFLEEYLQAWNDHDIDAIVAHLTPDVTWAHPGLPEAVHGHAAARKDLTETFEAFPDMHFLPEAFDVFVADDPTKAIGTWTWQGTMTGRMVPGYEPTGKPVLISGTCVYGFRDGLIAEHTIVFDALSLLQQTGLLPMDDSLSFKVMKEAQNLTVRIKKAVQK